jgi:hypothetical protein
MLPKLFLFGSNIMGVGTTMKSWSLVIMVHTQIGNGGEGLQIWRVAVNKLNQQPQTPSILDVGQENNDSSP